MATMTMDFGVPATRRRSAHSPVRLTARGRAVVALAIAVTALAVASIILSAVSSASVSALTSSTTTVARTIVAKPGDTLWGMAARELPGVDRREAVARIRTLNGMSPSATIVAGQEVSIPAA